MDPDGGGLTPPAGRCPCGCTCCGSPLPERQRAAATWKLKQAKETATASSSSRVEPEMEVAALREALLSHQLSVQELHTELDEERDASSTAASEALSMILRLQHEKAEAMLEARQFKRYAEEKMAHEQREIAVLEDLLFKREQAVLSLSAELQAYQQRIATHTPRSCHTPEAFADASYDDIPDYPPLHCVAVPAVDSDVYDDYGRNASHITQTPREHLQGIEHGIHQVERSPSYTNVMEKAVVGYSSSPRWSQSIHHCGMSNEGFRSGSFRRSYYNDEFPDGSDRFPAAVPGGENDYVKDRVYTVDAVHCAPAAYDDPMCTPRELPGFGERFGNGVDDESEVKRLYMRLQALEADRELMRQTIMSVSTDKSQMVLLKEIAQRLCKGATPKKKIVKKTSFIRNFSIVAAFQCVMSLIFGRWRKAPRRRYALGLSGNNAGLLLLLDKTPQVMRRGCLTGTPR